MTTSAIRILSTFSLALLAACHVDGPGAVIVTSPPARPVSILVEVYDPVTNQVWENVAVRVVQADQEWSQCTCPSPYQDWMLTSSDGRVLFNEFDLAAAEVGFVLNRDGGAVLGPGAAPASALSSGVVHPDANKQADNRTVGSARFIGTSLSGSSGYRSIVRFGGRSSTRSELS